MMAGLAILTSLCTATSKWLFHLHNGLKNLLSTSRCPMNHRFFALLLCVTTGCITPGEYKDLLDDASEIAAYGGARSSEESDVLPIGGVESNTLDLGEDVSVTQFG